MVNIRYETFETNSSSVHSLMIANDDEYNQLIAGTLYMDIYNDKYLSREEVTNILLAEPENELKNFWHDDCEKDTELIPTVEWFNTLSVEDFNEFVREFCDGICSFEDYGDGYEWYDEHYTSEHGDRIHIFGYYGRDC